MPCPCRTRGLSTPQCLPRPASPRPFAAGGAAGCPVQALPPPALGPVALPGQGAQGLKAPAARLGAPCCVSVFGDIYFY